MYLRRTSVSVDCACCCPMLLVWSMLTATKQDFSHFMCIRLGLPIQLRGGGAKELIWLKDAISKDCWFEPFWYEPLANLSLHIASVALGHYSKK